MPIMPQSMHVIVLYGQKACDQFSSMVHYYQRALDDNAWSRVCFIFASAGAREQPRLTDVPKDFMLDFAGMTEDRCMTLQRSTVDGIQKRCADGTVNFHFVCSDFETQEMNVESVPRLIENLRLYFDDRGLTMYTYVYLFLDTSSRVVAPQRAFLSALQRMGTNNLYPYFISRLQENGALCEQWPMQRAVMCEILAIMARARASANGKVYSLGYTSLNANDEELYACRWHALMTAFAEECRQPISGAAAWRMLSGNDLASYEPAHLRLYTENWLKWLAKNQMDGAFYALSQISNAAFDNLKQLVDLRAMPDDHQLPVILQNAVAQFYQMNFTYVLGEAPGVVQQQIRRFLQELSRMPNAATFPRELLTGLSAALKEIGVGSMPDVPLLPQKRVLQRSAEYKEKCFDVYDRYYRQACEAALIREYATRLRAAIPSIESFLDHTQAISDCLHQIARKETAQLPPDGKYIKYTKDVQDTLASCHASLFLTEENETLFHPETGQPQEEQIHRLLVQADKLLHGKMSAGFNGTFIRAISTEFDTPNKMNQFLGNYLVCRHRMFYSPYETNMLPETIVYVDAGLQIPQDPNAVQCLIKNDNAEKLIRYTLTHGLDFFLETDDQGKLYFAESASAGGFTQTDSFPQRTVTFIEEESASVVNPQTPPPPFDPKLTVTSKFRLTWNWEPGLNSVSIELNDQPARIVSISQYIMNNGYPVSKIINSGANYVRITRPDHSFYAELTFSGSPIPLRYKTKAEGNGAISLIIENPGTDVIQRMVLCETNGSRNVYYPMRAFDASRSNLCVYKNLRFSGSITLISDPQERSDPFHPVPVYKGELDYSL